MQLYELDLQLVACVEDACAVWHEGTGWAVLKDDVETARKALFWGRKLTAEEAKKEFPSADMDSIPDLASHPLASGVPGSADSAFLDKLEAMLDEDESEDT